MKNPTLQDISYFPGCSLATTARENNKALKQVFRQIGFNLLEVEDWNCCGSSSAHSLNRNLGMELASRNFAQAPAGRPLLVACPSCRVRLRGAQLEIQQSEARQHHYSEIWGRPFDPELQIIHFFELLETADFPESLSDRLSKLKYVPYYGCMLAYPPIMRHDRTHHGLLEKILGKFGAAAITWSHAYRCCGTFLSVARPEMVTPLVNEIVSKAIDTGADCIITACVMCHMNLEMRGTLKKKIPIIPLSLMLTLLLGVEPSRHEKLLSHHLVDPRPMLGSIGLI